MSHDVNQYLYIYKVRKALPLLLALLLSIFFFTPIAYADDILVHGGGDPFSNPLFRTPQGGDGGTGGDGDTNVYDGKGGTAEFLVGTLMAETINLLKKEAKLIFEVGTLDVKTGTTLNLYKTAKSDVKIATMNFGSNSQLTVAGDGEFDFNILQVGGADVTYMGSTAYLDNSKLLVFDISTVVSDDTMLFLSIPNDMSIDLNNIKLIPHKMTLSENDIVTLIDTSGTGNFKFFSNGVAWDDGAIIQRNFDGYMFALRNEAGNLIAEFLYIITDDDVPIIIPGKNQQ